MSLLSQYKGKHLKIVVAVPSMGMWMTPFGISLVGIFSAALQYKMGDVASQELQLFSCQGSILPKMRKEAVEHAIETKADYILFLDSDHGFPRSLVHRLLAAEKDIVAVNCVTKTVPSNTTARQKSDKTIWGEQVSSVGKHGLEKVWRVGTGVMLVHMGVFRNIGAKIFDMHWREDVKTYQGEDWSMCEAMEKAGYDIWVDHDLSVEVTHVGYLAYTHSMTIEGYSAGETHGE